MNNHFRGFAAAVFTGVLLIILSTTPAFSQDTNFPSVTVQPLSQTNYTGRSVTFTVSALGAEPFAYQWLKGTAKLVNSSHIAGATNTSLTISNLTTKDAGSYSVTITNNFGRTNSSSAVLTLLVPDVTLSITNIKSGQQWSNDTFTVRGKAASSIGVSNVFFSLNNTEWEDADTSNSQTIWSADLILIPGTNTIAAYAVDNSGNRSLTNTVRLVYYLTDVLTVRTNGSGKISISPAYNGARLQIGVNYSMSAKSSITGYGLVNWTDGSNNIVTNNATLKFMMASNLIFTANYGDNAKPSVKATFIATNGIPNGIVIRGTASDNVGVSNVFYRTSYNGNYSSWLPANTTNQWTNWTATVVLNPGLTTFYAYSVDSNLNSSIVFQFPIQNNTVSTKLSGLQATVIPDDGSAQFQVAFGAKTFSQLTSKGDTNNVNGVGSYTYTLIGDGNSAILKAKYTGPPSTINEGNQTYFLYFLYRNIASYSTTNIISTNVVVITTNSSVLETNLVATNFVMNVTGTMYFSTAPKYALASVVNQFLISAGQTNGGYGTLFQNGKFTSYPLLSSGTNTGSFTYTVYSPISAMFKLTNTNATDYIVATYEGTNFGSYYDEEYTPAGQTNGTDNGRFIFASQKPGGNAPLALTNRNFHIFAIDDDFNVQFGTSTYSQDSLNTNYDNDVGNYTYALANTNIGQLNLTVTEPPQLAGSTNAARLIFVASNAGLFTNDDGTISAFAMTSITNFAPVTITDLVPANTNATLDITEDTGFTDELQFFHDSSLSISGSPAGTYTYQPYSPIGSIVRFSITDTNYNFAAGTIQFKFQTTNSGAIYVNLFDAETNVTNSFGGTFKLH